MDGKRDEQMDALFAQAMSELAGFLKTSKREQTRSEKAVQVVARTTREIFHWLTIAIFIVPLSILSGIWSGIRNLWEFLF